MDTELSSTLVIRSIAPGELRLTDSWRVLCREAVVGVSLGLLLAELGLMLNRRLASSRRHVRRALSAARSDGRAQPGWGRAVGQPDGHGAAVSQPQPSATIDQRLHRRVTIALQIALLIGLGLELWNGQWLNAATTAAVLALTLLPVLLGRRFNVFIPPELEVLALLFVFAALFLGEVRGYYARYWWWDAVLHTASGFLLGIVGFLLVYVLNEKEDLELHMKPGFVALFSFMFAVGLGALWEIFEFAMDSVFGLNMQKSGLVDTMWDLIVDAAGALLIALLGYGYLSRARNVSFLERWIARFIHANRRFFEGSA